MDQGLSSNFASSISQDKYGFMWIGTTNGLNRYDGHGIKQYLHDAKDPFSIPGNVIYWLFKDRDGDMWLACGHQGVVKYNYATDGLKRLPLTRLLKMEKSIMPRFGVFTKTFKAEPTSPAVVHCFAIQKQQRL
jgi:ligand-binding sensor domain-containing protein